MTFCIYLILNANERVPESRIIAFDDQFKDVKNVYQCCSSCVYIRVRSPPDPSERGKQLDGIFFLNFFPIEEISDFNGKISYFDGEFHINFPPKMFPIKLFSPCPPVYTPDLKFEIREAQVE